MPRSLIPHIRTALQPPVFEDPEKTRVAAVLHRILLGVLVLMGTLFLSAFQPAVAPNPLPVMATELAAFLLALPCLTLLHRGHVRSAGQIFSWMTWVVVTAATVCFGGIQSPTVAAYVVVPVVSGYFLGWRSVIGFGVLTAAAGGAMAVADYHGWMPQPLSPITPLNAWVSLLVGLSLTTYLLHLALRSADEALEQARDNEHRALEATWAVQSGRALLEVRARQQAVIATLGKEALAGAPVGELAASLVASVAVTLDVPVAALLERRGDTLHLGLVEGPRNLPTTEGPRQIPLSRGTIVGDALLERQSMVVEDLEADERFPHAQWLRKMGLRSAVCVPVQGPEGQWGAISVYDRVPGRFTSDDMHFLQSTTHLLALALRREYDEAAARDSEEELRQAQKMEAVGRLAGGIAHDFNNLLTAISGHNELLRDALEPGSPQYEDAREIQHASERAASLTQQLLAFSRRQVMQPEVLDLNRVVLESLTMLSRLIGEDIELASDLEPGLAPVQVDRTQMEQVLLNLAVNSRDSMPVGGRLLLRTRTVTLDGNLGVPSPGLPTGTYVALEVSDTGVGMDEETRDQIFEPFFTTKDRFKGTGLGLSTVYGIVQQSGGGIEVESAPQKGATFRIFLPRSQERVPEQVIGTQAPAAPGCETLLLAEDDTAVRRLIRRTLESRGYQVLVAESGTEALEVARRHAEGIDLLVTDVIMPGLGGADLAEELRAADQTLRVLFVSGYADDMLGRQGVPSDRDAFLAKPFTPGTLARKVREVLDAE